MKVLSLFKVAVPLLLLAALPALAQRYAYIPRTTADQVSVFDTETNTFGAIIGVGDQPWSVAVHPDGSRAYIANVGSGTVSVIDTTDNTLLDTETVGTSPYHIAVSPDGSEVWVPNYDSDSVSIISTATNNVIHTIAGANSINSANAIAFNPAGTIAYVTNFSNGALVAIDTATRTIIGTHVIPTRSEGIAVSNDGSRVYLSFESASSAPRIFDVASSTLAVAPSLGATQWGVAVNPNGRYWYVAYGNDDVAVFNTSDNTLAATIDVGTGTRSPTGITVNAAGTMAYVANRNGGNSSLSVLNLVTNQLVDTPVAVAGRPYALGTSMARPLFGQGSIATGQYHSCRVLATGSVDCWGRNSDGQTTVPAGTFRQVVAGSAHTCGLKTDGTVSCWGNNTLGQATPLGGTFEQLASGPRHVCGLRSNGTVACWGENDQGQSTVPGAITDASAIAVGTSHSCALRASGTPNITCWGNGTSGQTTVPAGAYLQIAAGGGFTCGLLQAGTVNCWGDATGGKTTPPTGQFTKLFAQTAFACGIRVDGTTLCWGNESYDETVVPSGGHFDLATGRFHTCGLEAQGLARCWGWNFYNQAPQFALNPIGLDNAVIGEAIPPQTLEMVVANPGERDAYAPRPTAFAVISGTLPTGLSLSPAGVLTGTPSSLGTFNFTVQGEDSNGFHAERALSIMISGEDLTVPVIVPVVSGTAGIEGWYRGASVTVDWTITDPESGVVSSTGCGTTLVSTETAGQVVTCTATTLGGTTVASTTVKLDRTLPTATPTLSNKLPLRNEVISILANGVDPLSGVASEVCDALPTDTVSGELTRVNCVITDKAGNVVTRPTTYRVIYGFGGFLDTVFNPGWWNGAGLNQPITFKFRVTDALGGVTGLTSASFTSEALTCPATVKGVAPVSASAPGLVEIGDGYYEFTWVSPAAAGCARLTLNLGDGHHLKRAQFKFE